MDNLNERIARWMGEICRTGEYDREDPPNPYVEYPAYDTDPAAALRVLARMVESGWDAKMSNYSLEYIPGCEPWIIILRDGNVNVLISEADTPCAAICAAWLAEFGGEE